MMTQTLPYRRHLKRHDWPIIQRTEKRPGDLELTSDGLKRVKRHD